MDWWIGGLTFQLPFEVNWETSRALGASTKSNHRHLLSAHYELNTLHLKHFVEIVSFNPQLPYAVDITICCEVSCVSPKVMCWNFNP